MASAFFCVKKFEKKVMLKCLAADGSVVQFIQTEKTGILSQTFIENHNLSFAFESISLYILRL